MKTKITKHLLCGFLLIMLVTSLVFVCGFDVQATEEKATSGVCGENLIWSYDEMTGILTITGTGAMTDYGWGDYAPWKSLDVTKVVIGDGVTTLGSWAFYQMEGITAIEGGEGLVEIKNRAISECEGLTSYDIPANVSTIGSQAFDETNLVTVTGGENVTTLANEVFIRCSRLETIPEFPKLTSISYNVFNQTKWLANQEDFAVVNGIMVAYQGDDTEIVIPDTITGFAEVYGTKLFPNTITKVTFPDSYTTIPKKVFNNNTGLKEIVFGKNVEVIGESAFSGCTSLASVVIPDTVKEISKWAFDGCTGLMELTIPNGVFLDYCAFNDCTALTLKGMNIGKVGFGQYVFSSTDVESKFGFCGTDAMWKMDEEGTMTVYPFRVSEAEVTYEPKYNTTSTSNNILKSAVKKVIVEAGITSLYDAFDGYSALESVELPLTLKKINYRAFANTASLKTITLPEGITEIGSNAFTNSGITSISFPSTLVKIDSNAFDGATGLSTLVIPESVTSLGYRFIQESGVKELVLNADMAYTSSQPFEGCTSLEKVTFNKGSIGSDWGSSLFSASKDTLKEIVIGKDVKSIGENAFAGLTALEKVVFENGAYTSIGKNAFAGCISLAEVIIPESVTKIGESAFEGCTKLNKVTFYEGLKVIGRYAFFACPALKEVTIPYSVETIDYYAFNAYSIGESDRDKGYENITYYESFLMKGYINREGERYANRTTGIIFEPIGGDISGCTMKISPSSFTYDGTAKEPAVTVRTYYGTELPENAYTVPVYDNNKNVGTASVSVTANAPLTGTLTKTFSIKAPEGSGDTEDTGKAIISEEEKKVIYEHYSPIFAELAERGYAEPTMIDELLVIIKSVNSKFTKADVYVLLDENGIEYEDSGSSDDTTCSHSWNAGTVTKEPTCSASGEKTVACTKCGSVYIVTVPADAAKHAWDKGYIPEGKESTCSTMGVRVHTCGNCGTTKEESAPLNPAKHTWEEEYVVDKDPTCTEEGSKSIHCEECNVSDPTRIESIAMVPHEKSLLYSIVSLPNCVHGAKLMILCKNCDGEVFEDTIIETWPLPHTYKDKVTKATTKANGKIEAKCSECGYIDEEQTEVIAKPSKMTLSTPTYTYDGKTKKPTVKITDANGKTISSSNYSVSYPSSKNVGKYTVKVTFKGNYSGTMSSSFVINPKKTSMSSASAASKAFTAKWKKQSTQVTGYQIQYSTSKKFSSAKTVTVSSYKTTSKKVTKLKAKTTYYVRVRTYKTVGSTKFYSGWSSYKSVKTK